MDGGSPPRLGPSLVLRAVTPKEHVPDPNILPFSPKVPPLPAPLKSQKGRSMNAMRGDSGQGYWGRSRSGAKGSRKKRQSLESAKMLGFKPRSNLSASREKTSLAVRTREESGRRRDMGRRLEILTRCKVSRCRPLPAAPVLEAGGGSTEPYGGCHAAPAPPPRGDLRRCGSYTVWECALRDGQAKHRLGAAHARALPRGWTATSEGRSAAPRCTARPNKCHQSRERTNQDSRVLRSSKTTNKRSL